MPDETKYSELELTSAELKALQRLGANKDFDVFADIMLRWQVKRGLDLISTPHEAQDATLINHQGGYTLYRRMLKYIYGKED